ncbi:MAG: hypothetical protein AAF821_10055 [Cyanobacteria bacterium P01_D01_bin.156]
MMKNQLRSKILPYYFNIPPITENLLASKKQSETLFVLGSGTSICEYTARMWNHIQRNDSIGFNFWILHEFVPTFYVTELIASPLSSRYISLIKNLTLVKDRYASCLKMFKSPISGSRYRQIKKIGGYTANSHWIAAKDQQDLQNQLQVLTQKKSFYPVFCHQTATVDWTIFFSIILRYKKIVLCGVDLNNGDYFYESYREKIESRGLIVPENVQGRVHKTNDPEQNKGITIAEVIRAYQSADLKYLPDMYIASKSSALYPQLSLYDWDNASL